MTFATLALVVALGVIGPLLALPKRLHLPVLLGELLAGIVFGTTGLQILDPTDPIFVFLADMGFALVMFAAGTHVPVRDPAVRGALGAGIVRAALVGVVAAVAGWAVAAVFDIGHAAIYAVLMASSSAAMALPIIDSLRLSGPPVLALTAQVAIADTACIVALPLVIDPGNAARAALGAVVIAACGGVMFLILRYVQKTGAQRQVHEVSEERKFTLELRVSLVLVFALCGVASAMHVSIMLGGFVAGLAVAGIGEPRRVAKQVFAISDGLLAPLFFVWLGAKLNLREFGEHPQFILLGVTLGLGAVVVHWSTRLIGQPLAYGTLAAAQIGVPVAAVTVGSQLGVLVPGEGSAIMLATLCTIAGATVAASRLAAKAPV
ncbi:cation:proton antiporter [Nocardia asteroides NBRC 15531]|uniref:cation:proton antiporter n=1 Tax=Nocardia asteroides TaxID=1824 RepID=UPI0002D8093D|nr:cation:proton antiporter [Nocardia asteroides]TLF69146.1 cation:proton antiporter [Nocardia asteroides NBRC 15531]UGT48625.1 cation:proton antiporter [Nocardia asteroides]SFL65859.1 transporter, CPA2 family [Nocardia asteroides]VEG31839.1 glutathione-regulated potassium-efflux system protein KefB [Nocardia asteroides]